MWSVWQGMALPDQKPLILQAFLLHRQDLCIKIGYFWKIFQKLLDIYFKTWYALCQPSNVCPVNPQRPRKDNHGTHRFPPAGLRSGDHRYLQVHRLGRRRATGGHRQHLRVLAGPGLAVDRQQLTSSADACKSRGWCHTLIRRLLQKSIRRFFIVCLLCVVLKLLTIN